MNNLQNFTQYKSEQELLEAFAGIAFQKQHNLAEIIGNNDWNADLTSGIVTFGDFEAPIQILGTYSYESETWLWAWANTQSELSAEITQQANALKIFGEKQNIDFLQNAQLDFDNEVDLHIIGTIASGMFDSSAYYTADYGDGILVFTIDSQTIDNVPHDEHLRMASVIPQIISMYELNHRSAIQKYLEVLGYEITANTATLTATLTATKNDKKIEIDFDELGRMTNLKG